jgi:hypothetical protein
MLNKGQLRPIEYVGLERIGAMADGGYVVDGRLIDSATGILSLGLGFEWTFDEAVKGRNPHAVIIGVDSSISPELFIRMRRRSWVKIILYRLLGNAKKLQRHQRWKMISNQYKRLFQGKVQHLQKMVSAADGPETVSISTLMKMLPDESPYSVVVKMDIEGSEYSVIPDICDHASRISTLTAEFHDVTTTPQQFNNGISSLLQHFRIVHIHGNNYAPYCDEMQFPDVVEITFISRYLCPEPEVYSTRLFPDPQLDVPNNPDKPDYVLVFDQAES